MTRDIDHLREEFRDPEYRHAYIDSFVDSVVASQIRILRKHRGLSQEQLAELLGTGQSAISRLEDPNEPAGRIGTLKRLAEIFDIGLSVRFESFGEMLFEIEDRSPATLWQASFDEDPEFHGRAVEEDTSTAITIADLLRIWHSAGSSIGSKAMWWYPAPGAPTQQHLAPSCVPQSGLESQGASSLIPQDDISHYASTMDDSIAPSVQARPASGISSGAEQGIVA